MAFEETVGHAKVILEIEEQVDRDLREAQAKLDKQLAQIDKKEASVKLTADDKRLKEKIREDLKLLQQYEDKAEKAGSDADRKAARRDAKNTRARLTRARASNEKLFSQLEAFDKEREAAAATHEKRLGDIRLKGADKIRRINDKAEKERAAVAAAAEKAQEQAEKRASKIALDELERRTKREMRRRRDADREKAKLAADRAKADQKLLAEEEKVREKVTRDAEKRLEREIVAGRRAAAQRAREIEREEGQVERLTKRYIDLQKKRDRLGRSGSRLIQSPSERIMVEADTKAVVEEMKAVRARLVAMNRDPITIKFDAEGRGSEALSRWSNALSETAVRVGPFTTSVAGLTRAMALLGPVVTGVVGALGALVGAVGSAAVGFGGAAVAGIGAFGAALGGVAFLIPSLLRDFKSLNTLQKAYHTQVLKTGANSEKAKTKLKEFNHALGEVEPTTRKAFLSLDKLVDRWRDLSHQARPIFFNAIAQSIKTVNKGFDTFSKETLQSAGLVGKGWERLMKDLRSDEALQIFRDLSDAGQESFPPLAKALGNLGAALARIAVAFSKELPGLMRGFRDWTGGINDFTKDGSRMNDMVTTTVGSMRSLGRFLQASTKFLIAFFGQGVEPGVSMLDDMTNGINNWTDAINSGDTGLADFFKDSVDTTERLWNALKPLAELFMEWTTIMRPFTDTMIQVLGVMGDVVAGIAAFEPFKGLLRVAFGVFIVGALTGKIISVAGAMAQLVKTVQALGAARSGAAVLDALTAKSVPALGRKAAGTTASSMAAELGSGANVAKVGGGLRAALMGGLKFAGAAGLFVAAGDFIAKGFATVSNHEGFLSTARGLSNDFLSTMTLGLHDSAQEAADKAMPKVVQAIRNSMGHIDIGKTGIAMDLTVDQRKTAQNFAHAMRIADELVKNHNLPKLTTKFKVDVDPNQFKIIDRNLKRLEQNLNGSLSHMEQMTNQTLGAIEKSMGLHSKDGRVAVQQNMQATAFAIEKDMKNGSVSAKDGMKAIRNQFKIHSKAARETTGANFHAAAEAIKQAVHDGVISSKNGAKQINKLWEANLAIYGFTPKQARNIRRTGDADANKGREGGASRIIRPATGALLTVGNKGARGPDNVPMNLGGQPAVVGRGEQIAVFNHHQQRKFSAAYPGGLEGFFAGRQRRHNYSTGGGTGPQAGNRYAAGGMIAAANQLEKSHFPYVWGGGHQGSPAPFGPMDCSGAVSYVLQHGGLKIPTMVASQFMGIGQPGPGAVTVYANPEHTFMSINGKFFGTSNSNPGGGAGWFPKPDASYLNRFTVRHVDGLIGGDMGNIKMPNVLEGVGGMFADTVRAAVYSMTGAANSNLQSIASADFGGGDPGDPGAGAATRSQMVAWAHEALRRTGIFADSMQNVSKILTLAMKESSWVVDSINNWDSNAKAGNPSGGLMHVTLDKVGGSYARLFDPVLNIMASIRYQKERYGNLVTQSPYARGGLLMDRMNSNNSGGTVRRPTLMMGEEPSKEFVISTNPAYRGQNVARLALAAQSLGIPQAAKGYTPPNVKPPSTKAPVPRPGRVPKYPNKPKKRSIKKRRKAFKQGRSWSHYIDNLYKRRDLLNQEVDYREGKIEEPEDLIVESGRITVKDPNTGEMVDLGPNMVPNTTAIQEYQDEINYMLKAFTALQQVTGRLWTDIPKAIVAFQNERAWRRGLVKTLKGQINKDERRLNNRKLAKKDKHATRLRLRKNNQRLNENENIISDIGDDIGTMRDDRDDIGFDVRSLADDREQYVTDRDTIAGNASTQATSENTDTKGNAPTLDPNSGADVPSTAVQSQTFREERYNLLRDFGTNFAPLSMRNSPSLSPALTSNMSGFSLPTSSAFSSSGIGFNASAAVSGAFLSSGSAAQSVAGNLGAASARMSGTLSGGALTTAGETYVTVNNTFPTPPPDPHTWSKGVAYELQASL